MSYDEFMRDLLDVINRLRRRLEIKLKIKLDDIDEQVLYVAERISPRRNGLSELKKIIVIGCPGSGKTTFAEKLKDKIGLPLYYLDAIWHKPDRTHISREEYDARLAEILALDSWIVDGNYSRTIESRISVCDTVFLFDLPVEVCLDGAISRLGKERYDMPWIDTELDPNLKREIEEFPNKNLPTIYALIDKYKDGKTVVIFKSREQADAFLNGENL
jgi:adenylate kinase family enzyme